LSHSVTKLQLNSGLIEEFTIGPQVNSPSSKSAAGSPRPWHALDETEQAKHGHGLLNTLSRCLVQNAALPRSSTTPSAVSEQSFRPLNTSPRCCGEPIQITKDDRQDGFPTRVGVNRWPKAYRSSDHRFTRDVGCGDRHRWKVPQVLGTAEPVLSVLINRAEITASFRKPFRRRR
jgi:hypothetical protein